jgi:hypothetical protein
MRSIVYLCTFACYGLHLHHFFVAIRTTFVRMELHNREFERTTFILLFMYTYTKSKRITFTPGYILFFPTRTQA